MAEALSRRERFILAQIEQDLRVQDAELDRRLTTMRWDVPLPQAPPSAPCDGACGAAHGLGAVFRGLLGSVATAAAAALISACTTVWGLTLTCLARLMGRCARLRGTDDRDRRRTP
ncbi:DUF3040 domain-containing protein [Streptomyces sp. NPDC059101]|uniref:DUF3040 domain-containing protein n=1 Tax=Streptomyces sp. NPDC059101 TaxID=3346728 RepID=UPI00367CD8C9